MEKLFLLLDYMEDKERTNIWWELKYEELIESVLDAAYQLVFETTTYSCPCLLFVCFAIFVVCLLGVRSSLQTGLEESTDL